MSTESILLLNTMREYEVSFEDLAEYLNLHVNKVRSMIFSAMDFSKFNKLYYKILEVDAKRSTDNGINTEDQQIAKYYNAIKVDLAI